MDITWYGQACFRLRHKGVTVVADPYDKSIGLKLPRMTADIVTVSRRHSDHNHVEAVQGEPFTIDGPGEYEIGGLFITGIAMADGSKESTERGRNTTYIMEFADATVCHLGDLSRIPTQAQVEEMSHVDVLLVPVGGSHTIDATQAAEVISLIEPSVVIPMQYALPSLTVSLDPVDRFLKEMGAKEAQRQDSLRVRKKQLPQETQVVILECRVG